MDNLTLAAATTAGPRSAPLPTAVPEVAGERLLRRGLGAVGLGGIALIHVLDLPGKIEETPYLAVGYGLLIVAALVAAEALLRRENPLIWMFGGAVAGSALIGYVLSRTTGLPAATEDIGNWLEPLGVASLFVEGVVIVLSGIALLRNGKRS